MDKDRALELKLALATKRKFRGLSAKEIHTIIGKIKEKNNGTLVGLKFAVFMALCSKSFVISPSWFKIELETKEFIPMLLKQL